MPRILIVDDQKDVSRLLRSALETIEQGLQVTEAPSGEEAILEASHSKVDLLIADFRLPGITGVELMKKIRARNPDVKVILITGVTEKKLLKEVADAGADAYFSKPVSMGDFLDAVERTLGLTRTILHKTEDDGQQSDESKARKSLSSTLVNLRKELGAQAVLLLNGMGHVEAEAGQLPDPNTTVSLISSLMGMFNAAQKVAVFLDHAQTHLHLFDGKNIDAVSLPVGNTHALLVVGKGLAAKSLAGKLDVLFAARLELAQILKSMGFSSDTEEKPKNTAAALEEPFTQPEDLPSEFMDIFAQIGQKTNDAKSFWDSAVEQGTTFTEPDKLTYEQASRLGLTPDSAQKK